VRPSRRSRGHRGRRCLSPPCAAVGRPSAPTSSTNRPRVSMHASLHPSPVGSTAGSPELAGAAPPPMAKGHIARAQILPGCFVQSRGKSVRLWKVLGTSLQKGNFNSKRLLLILVKSLENRIKIGKMQTQFC
jgi:hypothetical protein